MSLLWLRLRAYKMRPNTTLVFLKALPVQFKLIPLIDKELDELVEAGIFTKIENSEWAISSAES